MRSGRVCIPVLVFAVVSAMLPCRGVAQGEVPFAPGTRIRYVESPRTERIVANVVVLYGDSLLVRLAARSEPVALAVPNLTRLEISRGTENHMLLFAAVGFVAGALDGRGDLPGVQALSAQQPDSAYARSVAAIARRQAMDDSVAVPGARSILLTAGARAPRAIVLLHGLTDSPRQFEALAYLLYADGNNVYVPRLPQHGLRGGTVGTLSALTAAQLRGVADSVVNEARGLGDSVVVVGLSMGATMGGWIAQHRAVSRVVLIAPAIEPGRIPALLDRPLIGLADRLPSVTRRSRADAAGADREAGFNSRAAAEILEMGRAIQGEAAREPPRTGDIVVLVNAADRTVKESAAEGLARDWALHGAAVAVYELPDSLRLPHNIIDPLRGRAGGAAVLALLQQLACGRPPTALARRLVVHD